MLLLPTSWLSYSQLSSLYLSTLLSPTFALGIFFLLLEISSNRVHMWEFLLPLGWVGAEVFILRLGLAKARNDALWNDVDQVVVSYLAIEIKAIDIASVFLDSTCVLEIPDFVKSPLWLVVVTIIFLDSILDLFPSMKPMLVGFPAFLCISLCT